MEFLELTARQEEISKRLDELKAFTTGDQKRALTVDETSEVVTLGDELDTINEKIERHEKAKRILAAQKKKDRANRTTDEDSLVKNYSVSRAVLSMNKGSFHRDGGAELEAHQEGVNIARSSDLPMTGKGIMVPEFVQRATAANALAASNLIPTNQMPLLEGYKPKLVLEEMGATMHRGLVGINNFPVADMQADAGFVGEAAASNVREPNVRRPQAVAKAVRAKTLATWLLKAQAGAATDALLTRNLLRAESNALNRVGIAGGGTNEPTGITANADVTTVAIGANGGALTYAKLVELMVAPENNDAGMFDKYGFITTPGVKGQLMQTAIESGDSLRVWNPLTPDQLLGYKAACTTLTPSNGSKGSGTNLHAILFGAFSEMHVCNWAVRELILDPASDDTGLYVKLISFWDIVLANPKAFAKIVDVAV